MIGEKKRSQENPNCWFTSSWIGVFGFAKLSQDHTTHPNLSHTLWGGCHTCDLSHVVLHGPREGSRPGNLCVISTLQRWQCLGWKDENLRRDDSTRHWAAGLCLWTGYFEPQGWTSYALRQSQKFWTDLKHFRSERLSDKILILFLYHCIALWELCFGSPLYSSGSLHLPPWCKCPP